MEAKKPSTFAVRFIINNYDFPAFQCENAIGEQLSGVRKKHWSHWEFEGENYPTYQLYDLIKVKQILQFSVTKRMPKPVTSCASGWMERRTEREYTIIGTNHASDCANQPLGNLFFVVFK